MIATRRYPAVFAISSARASRILPKLRCCHSSTSAASAPTGHQAPVHVELADERGLVELGAELRRREPEPGKPDERVARYRGDEVLRSPAALVGYHPDLGLLV